MATFIPSKYQQAVYDIALTREFVREFITISYIKKNFKTKKEAYNALNSIDDLVSSNSELEELIEYIFTKEYSVDYTIKELISMLRNKLL